MGKQLNYYMNYNGFLDVAQYALDIGCKILKKEKEIIICSEDIRIVSSDTSRYYFYLPQAGALDIQKRNNVEYVGGYNSSGNVIIEAGYSVVDHAKQKISRARIFSITGYYDTYGNWIARSECVKKAYDSLSRKIKKIAPYTEITDFIVNSPDVEPKEWKHKEYIMEELLALKVSAGYELRI